MSTDGFNPCVSCSYVVWINFGINEIAFRFSYIRFLPKLSLIKPKVY